MTKEQVLQDLQFLARRYEELDQVKYAINRESLDQSILALLENNKLKEEIEQLKSVIDKYEQLSDLDIHQAVALLVKQTYSISILEDLVQNLSVKLAKAQLTIDDLQNECSKKD